MKQQIKIVKIISTSELVINAGFNMNIKKGDYFQIIGKKGTEPVIDPDTGENLGTLDIIKGIVQADKVYPRMSIVCAYKNLTPSFRVADVLSSSLSVKKDLNVNKSQITGGMPESKDDPIRIGDIVIPINNN